MFNFTIPAFTYLNISIEQAKTQWPYKQKVCPDCNHDLSLADIDYAGYCLTCGCDWGVPKVTD